MPLLQTSGNVTADGYGGGAAAVPNYIENVFSTWLYTGTSATQTITNGIDLSTKGGLVWSKSRSTIDNNVLLDTIRGPNNILVSNTTAAGSTSGTPYVTASTTGYSIGTSNSQINGSGNNYASWTFRKQPKFFDVVTFVAGSSTNRTVSHSLGSVPGFYVMKDVSAVSQWPAYHRSLGANQYLALNKTDAITTYSGAWGTGPTSTTFSVDETAFCTAGNTYVVYLYAHNAGGFGLTGTDNVISCGSWTSAGSTPVSVNLGYEPQWILWKRTNSTGGNWYLNDNMRGMPVQNGAGTGCKFLYPNLSDAEYGDYGMDPTSTGFNAISGASGNTFIYIAIRRGPMKVPTSGTSVYNAVPYSGNNTNPRLLDFSLNLDAALFHKRNSAIDTSNQFGSRLAGSVSMPTNATNVESPFYINNWASNIGVAVKDDGQINGNTYTYIGWGLKRSPNFFDVVCYTGTGAVTTQTHNLGVAPELMIVKSRSLGTESWTVWNTTIASLNSANFLWLNSTSNIVTNNNRFNSTAPTSSVFTVGSDTSTNGSGSTYVAYLFATLAGVSKVGSYTGNGSTQTINCGFTGGARFVLIKRTDATGDWYVYDTARGMTTLTDPYLLLNSTAAESATLGSVTTVSTGFAVDASILAAINTNAASYIFLAIA